ncbi:uncharacterized protein LOC134705307 [Mytilus trossulus]|uniref:uncharacterized protein LOC134705307 n=1 Tax=Mytilus trossulus TaxID=6551 RepID=UPI003006D57F
MIIHWHLGANKMSVIHLIVYSLLLIISVCYGYTSNKNTMKFETDNDRRVVPNALSTIIKRVPFVACASLCSLNEYCCLSSCDKTYKQCQLVHECNSEIQPWQNGIVIRKKRYVGCYTDYCPNHRRILGDKAMVRISDLSSEKCNILCQGYRYFGIENSHECFCGNNMDTITFPKTPERECNMACTGDRTQMCGGFCRISIYYVLRKQ